MPSATKGGLIYTLRIGDEQVNGKLVQIEIVRSSCFKLPAAAQSGSHWYLLQKKMWKILLLLEKLLYVYI